MAEAQLTDELGFAMASTGCASTNLITPLLCAWQDGVPVIFVTGQNTLAETSAFTGVNVRTYGQQEANIIPVVQSLTKYSAMVTCANEVPAVLEQAIVAALNGRKGPVWIDVPLDIQSARITNFDLPSGLMTTQLPNNGRLQEDVQFVIDRLNGSKRPVLIIGSGIRSAGAIAELESFVQINQVPVVYTASSVDIYPKINELAVGSLGSMGCSREAALTVQNSDFVLVLGNRMPSIVTGVDFCKFARGATVCAVDVDPSEYHKEGIRVDRFVHSDVKTFFELTSGRQITAPQRDWLEKVNSYKATFSDDAPFPPCEDGRVDLHDLAGVLSKTMDDDAVLITDSGFIEVILPTNIDFSPSRRAVHPVSQGAMGFAIPAIVGSFFADRSKQLVCVVGDGTIMMNLQELQTIRQQAIPAKIFVINNNIYSIIRRRQKELFRKRTIGTGVEDGVSTPDFSAIAETFGLHYSSITCGDELSEGVAAVLAKDGPQLCEIYGRLDQEYIEVSHAKTSTGKFVRRPLEDQWPFLPRDVFLDLMIEEPIDQ
jgi:acetolactate synthase-1/2/3 large subunit